MPIVTAAVVAVTAAIATTTVATVAAAAVAVGTLVGTMGLAVGVVGMATGNKDLMKAGQIMGYVGLAGGLAGLGAGALASAESVASSLVTPSVQGGVTGAIEQAGQVGAGTVLAPATAPAVGAGTVLEPASQAGASGVLNAAVPAATDAAADVASQAAPSASPIADAAQQGTTAAGNPIAAPEVSNLSAATQAPVGSLAGTVAPAAPAATTDALGVATNAASQAPGLVGAASTPAVGSSKVQGFWNSLPDWQKAQVVTTGGQALAGMAGGWFQGLSASERLELDKLMNEQRQNQVNYLNANNRYAPKLSFGSPSKPGLMGAAGKA